MQGNQKRNRLRLGAVPTIDVPVLVQPCFKLLHETEKKRSVVRVKTSNNMAVSDQPNTQQAGIRKRSHEDEDGEDSSDTKTVLPIAKERGERKKKYLKLDQECFLKAVGLVPVDSVW